MNGGNIAVKTNFTEVQLYSCHRTPAILPFSWVIDRVVMLWAEGELLSLRLSNVEGRGSRQVWYYHDVVGMIFVIRRAYSSCQLELQQWEQTHQLRKLASTFHRLQDQYILLHH